MTYTALDIRAKDDISKGIVVVSSLLTAFVGLIYYASFSGAGQPAFDIYTTLGPIPHTLVYLDVVGFVLPLLASLAMILMIVRKREGRGVSLEWRVWIVAYLAGSIGIAAFSYHTSMFEVVHPGRGYGENVAIFLLSSFFLVLAKFVMAGNDVALYLSYPLMFYTGLLSDIVSTNLTSGSLIFGGVGVFDGDFFIPLIYLAIFSWLRLMRIERRLVVKRR